MMRTHIDWITFTMTPRYRSAYPEGTPFDEQYAEALKGAFIGTFGEALTAEAFGGTWTKNERSRAPYTDAWKLEDRGVTLYASETLNHCCIEISGQGCEKLIAMDLLNELLTKIADRVTRIDIASDIETEIRPDQFVSKLNHERMRASGYQKSETGETSYVGSQKSDRYARVYRYNPPHPRAHLLRVEHVFRKTYAKQVAIACLNSSVESIALYAGSAFGWAHEIWQPGSVESATIQMVYEQRPTAKTVFWLVNSCASAFKRLCSDGTIVDPEGFLKTYFLNEE